MKNFGFGCMRLPMRGDQVDQEHFNRMVDKFLEEGFIYFDTAHGYLNGKSELAIREGLAKRYPRERYILTDKLTGVFFKTEADILPLFQQQLDACGVEYFDYYLLHALSANKYQHYTSCNAFEVCRKLKEEGKIRHLGISFHDRADVLERILSEHPEIEVVQIQFNYADYDSPTIQSGPVYEVCRKFNKPVIVMEPVKGGNLTGLPQQALDVFDSLGGGSPASYAIRYAASFEGIFMVLSGMSTYEQMEDNLSYMKEFQPLSPEEFAAVDRVREIIKKQDTIPCTACQYCVPGCPRQIRIPDLFSCMNTRKQYPNMDWNSRTYYQAAVRGQGMARDCIGCKQCERACPQHLPIVSLLKEVSQVFDQEG